MSAMKLTAETLRRLVRESLDEAPIRIKTATPGHRDAAADAVKTLRKGRDAGKADYASAYASKASGAGAKGVGKRGGYDAPGVPTKENDPMAELDELSSLGEMDELDEDMMPASMHPSVGDRKSPPPLPQKKPGGGAPNLKGFKADCNMMADAASRVKQILDAGQGDTKEALRWLDKVVQFAQSAQKNLKN